MPVTPTRSKLFTASLAAFALLALGACAKKGDLDETGGIVAVRSSCPVAAIPAQTGDVTLFNPVGSTDANAIDVVASMTNLRSTCSDSGDQYYTEATFDVLASRRDASVAREIDLPYYSVVVRGGNAVIAKRIGHVRLSFAAGQYRAQASAKGASYVDRTQATLPEGIQRKITEKRKSGEE